MTFKQRAGLVLLFALCVSGRLPTLVEDRPDGSKDIFRVNPSPPVALGEILVRHSLEVSDLEYIFNYNAEKWVESYQPIWIPKKDVDEAVTEQNCKALFGSGKITFKGYRAYYRSDTVTWIYSTSGHLELDVKPFSIGLTSQRQIPLNRLRVNCDPLSFTGCWAIPEKKQIPYLILNSKTRTALMAGTCDFCVIGACTTSCPNGKYASTNALLEPESNLQMSDLACIPCKNGTWNTCRNKKDCSWSVIIFFFCCYTHVTWNVFAGQCPWQEILM